MKNGVLYIQINEKLFKISVKSVEIGVYSEVTKNFCNKFTIKITNLKTKVSKYFVFYDSHYNYTQGKTTLDVSDLARAASCIMDDALQGNQSFEEFTSEIWPPTNEEDYQNAKRAYKACITTLNKLKQLGLDIEEIENLYNQFINI